MCRAGVYIRTITGAGTPALGLRCMPVLEEGGGRGDKMFWAEKSDRFFL